MAEFIGRCVSRRRTLLIRKFATRESFRSRQHAQGRVCSPDFIRVICTAIGQNRRVLRRFFARESRQLTRIMIGFRPAISGLLECGAPSHRFPCLVRSKATRRRVALPKLREIEQRFLPIRVHSCHSRAKLRLRRSRARHQEITHADPGMVREIAIEE